LASLFPGFQPSQLIALLQMTPGGDVSAAANELMALGVPPGGDPACLDAAAYEYAAEVLGLTPDNSSSSSSSSLTPAAVPTTSLQDKAQQLMAMFEVRCMEWGLHFFIH
jgi:hypothetical protein